MVVDLRFVGGRLVHMPVGTYAWVDIKQFTYRRGEDRQVLAALLGHREYRDHYAGGLVDEQSEHDLHGPYRLAALSAASFTPVTEAQAHTMLESWLSGWDSSVVSQMRALLVGEVYPLLAGGSVYQLPDLRSDAGHDWGWVVGLSGFYEFVVLDRGRGKLTVVVVSDD